jgi:uncharacterized damage-inducible protein DinB
MSIGQSLSAELQYEAQGTRRVLERVPLDNREWTPHTKSMSLVRLASHIAEIPGWAGTILEQDQFEMNTSEYVPREANSSAELLQLFDDGVKHAIELLSEVDDDRMMGIWRMIADGKTVVEMPRAMVVRGFMLSHLIHHRGQLTVYLRMQDVALPAIYGPSADEEN